MLEGRGRLSGMTPSALSKVASQPSQHFLIPMHSPQHLRKFTGLIPRCSHLILLNVMRYLGVRQTLLCIVVCLLFIMPLQAQDWIDHLTAGVGAGFTFPLSSTADHTKMGWNF